MSEKKSFIKKCPFCGEKFITQYEQKKFCCLKCKNAFNSRKARKERCEKICARCGKRFSTKKRHSAKFCVDCSGEMKKRFCAFCNKELPKGRVKYCSDECCRKNKQKFIFEEEKISTNEKLLSIGKDINSIVKSALEHHMSYGKYVEMLEKQTEHGG